MLRGKYVNIRPIQKSDLKYIKSWINDAEVQYYSQENYPFYFSNLLIKKIYSDAIKGRRLVFIIEDKNGQVIGELWLHPIDYKKKTTELVIVIGKKELRGKGYGRDAINTIKDYCFNTLKLNSIYLKVFSFNIRGIKCYKACGFKVIGKCDRKVNRFGVEYDELIMELKNNE